MGFLDLFITPDAARVPQEVKPPVRPVAPVPALSPVHDGTSTLAVASTALRTTGDAVPPQFREAVDTAFAEAAAPHLAVYLSLEQGFREMVTDATTRAALALKGAATQGHARDAILVDVHEAAEALAAVQSDAEKARDAALARDAVALETRVQEARAQAQALREQATALDAQAATLTVEAAQARAEIEASYQSISAYIDTRHRELVAIEQMFGGPS